jgi:hypothetical protein
LTLQAGLERPLPDALPAGRASVVLCAGSCGADIKRLEALVDGEAHRLTVRGRRFWGTVPIAARPAGASVRMALRSGTAVSDLGTIAVSQTASGVPGSAAIAVCMATFEPNMELFRTQVRSLREQTERDWVCVVSDDCSSPQGYAGIEAELAGDPRFILSRAPRRLGFYRNFERALYLAPPAAELIALCDQDDRWAADKLATLRAALDGGALLAYSDLRLTQAGGQVLRETLWRGRANNHTDLISMLVANSITGAATLFRRELLDVLLPFPDTPGFQFHDHWLAVAALARGEVAYVERPLYDYVQHPGAVFGHVTHGERPASRRPLLERWRAAYFYGYLPRRQQAQVVLARAGNAIAPRKRAQLERFTAAERSPLGPPWLALRALRVFGGRTETLGSELELAKGLLWLWLARLGLPVNTTFPALEAFTQKRLRRWRAAIGQG